MNGGIVLGTGQKSIVMDYGGKDKETFQHKQFSKIHALYVYLKKKEIVQIKIDPHMITTLKSLDKKHHYVVKEFKDPFFPGYTSKTYFLRELTGVQHIPSDIIGLNNLYGIEVVDDNGTHCYTISRKCKNTIKSDMKPREFERLVKDILTQLMMVQKQNLAHGDIKLDNIMKCKKYELIDWENSRTLDYDTLVQQRYLGLSPMYFQILYGAAWYPAFSVALLKYYQETGGYDTYVTSEYANRMTSYFQDLFSKHTPKEVFEKTKYTLDVGTFGFILYGALRNPALRRYESFVMNMYKMTPSQALKYFKKTKRNVSI